MKFMENHSLNDGDKFIAEMMRESSNHRTLGTSTKKLVDCLHTHKKKSISSLLLNSPTFIHCCLAALRILEVSDSAQTWDTVSCKIVIAYSVCELIVNEGMLMKVRSAYCKTDFEWDNLKRLASKVENIAFVSPKNEKYVILFLLSIFMTRVVRRRCCDFLITCSCCVWTDGGGS